MSHKRRLLVIVIIGLALAGLTAILQAGGGRGSGGVSTVEIRGGNAESIREFFARTLRSYGPAGDTIIVYVGSLPDDLPFDLPLPEDARLIGSITHSVYTSTEIIFDTAVSPKDLVAFYTENLPGDAWRANTNLPVPQGGFVQQETSIGNFCSTTGEFWMTINSTAMDGELTDAHIYISAPGDPSTCGGNEINMATDAFTMLPELRTPEGVEILPQVSSGGGGGGGFGQRYASMGVVLGTERPLADVLTDYNVQLEGAGWHNVMAESGTGFAWSSWTITDESGVIWGGTLTITASPTSENEFSATITVAEAVQDAR
ncbi:MAG: hypothetical protein H6672_00915 [Anaerolineaceae bacterium]|nr:hypothetical protein [Anaerolineaceae bacterium]